MMPDPERQRAHADRQIWRFYPDGVSRDEFREGVESQKL